jgi:hypothetical protein
LIEYGFNFLLFFVICRRMEDDILISASLE